MSKSVEPKGAGGQAEVEVEEARQTRVRRAPACCARCFVTVGARPLTGDTMSGVARDVAAGAAETKERPSVPQLLAA